MFPLLFCVCVLGVRSVKKNTKKYCYSVFILEPLPRAVEMGRSSISRFVCVDNTMRVHLRGTNNGVICSAADYGFSVLIAHCSVCSWEFWSPVPYVFRVLLPSICHFGRLFAFFLHGLDGY